MISIVIPAFNEEAVLPALFERLRPVIDGLNEPAEVIFVDDGSRDRTAAMIDDEAKRWPAVRLVQLGRNRGHQMAITAGIDLARGDWVVTMDADLQDPPELIPEMLRVARTQQVDVVYAQRNDRTADTWFKRRTAHLYYALIRRVTDVDPPAHVGDFRLLSARATSALRNLPERHRVYRLLIPWLGFPSALIQYKRDHRAAGKTKYSLTRMMLLASNSITSFSTAPLRLAMAFGMVTAVVALMLSFLAAGAWIFGHTVPGWASVAVGMLFLGAVQLICVGVLGEYVGRIYEEVQGRPMYRVARDTLRSANEPEARVPVQQ